MKTGHNKRNQGDIIIRHNYVAVGLGMNRGQGDGWAGVSSVLKIAIKVENMRRTRCTVEVRVIDK